MRETAAATLVFKGALLERKGEPEKAVDALSEALCKFGPSSETPAKSAVGAFVERAGLLYDLDRYDEALADCDAFLAHFDGAGLPQASQFVVKALLIKGVSLAATDHIADAIDILEQVIERFSDDAAELVRDYVVHAKEIVRQLRALSRALGLRFVRPLDSQGMKKISYSGYRFPPELRGSRIASQPLGSSIRS